MFQITVWQWIRGFKHRVLEPEVLAGDDGEPEDLLDQRQQRQRQEHQPHDEEQLNK